MRKAEDESLKAIPNESSWVHFSAHLRQQAPPYFRSEMCRMYVNSSFVGQAGWAEMKEEEEGGK